MFVRRIPKISLSNFFLKNQAAQLVCREGGWSIHPKQTNSFYTLHYQPMAHIFCKSRYMYCTGYLFLPVWTSFPKFDCPSDQALTGYAPINTLRGLENNHQTLGLLWCSPFLVKCAAAAIMPDAFPPCLEKQQLKPELFKETFGEDLLNCLNMWGRMKCSFPSPNSFLLHVSFGLFQSLYVF